MRILHTADWHLGHSLNGWPRDAEHRAWLGRLAELIGEEEIDVLIVAGDIFDGINPSGEAQRLLYEALRAFRERRPSLVTVITAGNHDPAGRLEAPSAILRSLDVHVVGTVRRIDGEIDIGHHLVPIRDAKGDVRAHVLAIPFLRAADLPGLSFAGEETGVSPVVAAARAFHAGIAAAADAVADGLPVIATGHLHCAGGTESEGAERRILIGGEHALPADVFPASFAYVALGHLHGPQSLDGGRIRYSGSCFPLSSSEIGYDHGVTILDLDADGIAARHVAIPRPAAFHRLPASGAIGLGAFEEALAGLDLDPGLPKDLQPFVYATLQAEGPASVLLSEAERLLAEYPVRQGGIRIQRALEEGAAAQSLLTLDETNPEDLFVAAFRKVNGSDPEARHLSAFRDTINGA
ncbi:exonuclease SbcCD subunit D [Defluviimonas salinarum]|uniref:Nuclease SbcCD subunit D n=1 Tax=Defluviimonas salinarum TaxID=2992147 RepID=A0ABT3J5D0_9RHOB|nr:exonuclease SbcCD subunit D [Defluviimonas salinarum]MCW3782900.1 exonuclease SbcCD subunit D [Defluviimonas salinarum]